MSSPKVQRRNDTSLTPSPKERSNNGPPSQPKEGRNLFKSNDFATKESKPQVLETPMLTFGANTNFFKFKKIIEPNMTQLYGRHASFIETKAYITFPLIVYPVPPSSTSTLVVDFHNRDYAELRKENGFTREG